MRKFWGLYKNESYSVGCNGATVYVYDRDGKELAKFKDIPYAYDAAFMPGKNIVAVKSTQGFLAFYDLNALSLIRKITVTQIGAQDEGFAFSPDGKLFYNIEKPVYSTRTQLGIYDTVSFERIDALFTEDDKMVLDCLEFDNDTGECFVLGFMRGDDGAYDYGFVARFDQVSKKVCDYHPIKERQYDYLRSYKAWERSGFTEKKLEWSLLKNLECINKTSVKEVFELLEKR